MAEQDIDFELIEDDADGQHEDEFETDEETTPSDDESIEDGEDDTTSAKSKKSNWKKMSKINKGLRAENAKIRAKLAKLEAQKANPVDDEDDEDYEDDTPDNSYDATELRFFFIENPEAKEVKNEITEVLDKYPNMSFEDAFALVKAKTPEQSTSSTSFSTRGSNTKVKKTLYQLTEDEALKLSPAQYLEYKRKVQGMNI